MGKVDIYFGAPLFNEMEQMFNENLVGKIRDKFGDKVRVYLPQENTEINDKSESADSLNIYYGDTERLKSTDILIAVLDGQTPDVGLATEVGYFARMVEEQPEKDLHIIGLYSDIRQRDVTENKVLELERLAESQWSYINLYLVGAIKSNGQVVPSTESLLNAIENRLDMLDIK